MQLQIFHKAMSKQSAVTCLKKQGVKYGRWKNKKLKIHTNLFTKQVFTLIHTHLNTFVYLLYF